MMQINARFLYKKQTNMAGNNDDTDDTSKIQPTNQTLPCNSGHVHEVFFAQNKVTFYSVHEDGRKTLAQKRMIQLKNLAQVKYNNCNNLIERV